MLHENANYAAVLDGLTGLIKQSLDAYSAEASRPQRQADAMDYYLKTTGDRAAQLRRIRNEFENIMAAPLEEYP